MFASFGILNGRKERSNKAAEIHGTWGGTNFVLERQ
jgi:hypothetical protein